MRLLRRSIAWLFYLGLLAAVGAGTFLFVRYRPRCTAAEPFIAAVHLSADGSRLVTLKQSKAKVEGPVKVWDTHRGEVVREMLGERKLELPAERFCDERHFAARLPDGGLRLVDWRTGEEWTFDEPKDVQYFSMSPKGRWLFVHGDAPRGGVLLDLTTRQIRCRVGDKHLEFSPDDRWGFARGGNNHPLDVWDPVTAKKVATIPVESGTVTSPDGGSLIVWLLGGEADRAQSERLKMRIPDRGLEIWDLATGRMRHRLAFPTPGMGHAEFSPNSRFLALFLEHPDQSKLKVLDAASGQTLWETGAMAAGEFSPDSTLYFYWRGDKGQTLTMCDAATGEKLWERHETGPTITRFAGASGKVLFQERGDRALLLLDVRTGEPLPLTPPGFYMSNSLPVPTPDGKHLVMSGWQKRTRAPYFWETWLEKHWPQWFGDTLAVTFVLESATGRELFRIRNEANRVMLSDDGSTLIAFDDLDAEGRSGMIRIWDVHPHRAWTWALASIPATMLVSFSLSRLHRAWRKRKPASSVPPGVSTQSDA